MWKQYFKLYLTIIIFIIICVYNIYACFEPSCMKNNAKLKYILQWTPAQREHFVWVGTGRQGFIKRNCTYTNCYITLNRNLLGDYTKFDVIAFDGPYIVLTNLNKEHLPQRRLPYQKYVFASIESSAYYPIDKPYFDDYFNWTWTYRLDSDLIWGYILIKDKKGRIIGPKKKMSWLKHEKMLPVSEELRTALKRKTKTAVGLLSNCHTKSKRREYVAELGKVLKDKYNLTIDIYGSCSEKRCKNCEAMIKRDYFFYLAFENSFSKDYVSEKVSRALECNTIPIVYGGADYTRFLSEGSYLDALKLGVDKLAWKIYELINDFEQYVEYFRWTNHYSYFRRHDYCDICALLNNKRKVRSVSRYKHFRKWWNK